MNPSSPLRLVKGPDTKETAEPEELDVTDIAAVFRKYAPYVAKIGMRLLGNPDETDDLVQDVFLDAHRGLKGLRDPKLVRFWLARIAVRKARKRLRKRAMLRVLGLDRPVDPDLAPDQANAVDHAKLIAVYQILESVPADARIAWVLHRVEGENLAAIAELCDCSRATAHRRVRTAQVALEQGLGHA